MFVIFVWFCVNSMTIHIQPLKYWTFAVFSLGDQPPNSVNPELRNRKNVLRERRSWSSAKKKSQNFQFCASRLFERLVTVDQEKDELIVT
jgi:hypothetical protein